MSIKLRKLSDQVIVITGASSGIGLTTARAAAKQGAKLVLAARSEDALKTLQQEIQNAGGEAIYVVADVTRPEDVQRIAQTAIERFGRFDTWVNDAGGSVYGRIMDVPVEDERQLFEVNYWGVVYGSRVAAEHLRSRGGALINIGSVASDRAIPLQSSYSASKHAVKAFTDALRSELEKDGAPVSVTLIKPTAIDTPFFRHAKTYMDAQPVEPPPMYAPEAVAKAILRAAEHPVRDILVGGLAPLQSAMGRLMPRLGDRFMKAMMFEGQKSARPPRPGDNQIFERPSGSLRERGGYGTTVLERSAYTEAAMRPWLTRAAMVGAGVALATLIVGSRRRRHSRA
jgi:short-subunit dehydrogenase